MGLCTVPLGFCEANFEGYLAFFWDREWPELAKNWPFHWPKTGQFAGRFGPLFGLKLASKLASKLAGTAVRAKFEAKSKAKFGPNLGQFWAKPGPHTRPTWGSNSGILWANFRTKVWPAKRPNKLARQLWFQGTAH